MKKWICGLLTVMLTMLLAVPALAIVPAPENTFVGDYADVLSEKTEQHILNRNDKLARATGGAIVIVTVDFMDGMDSADYAYECFNTWQIGDAERNNGLLLVYAVGENKVRAMAGVGIEDALNASVLNKWLEDYFYGGYDLGEYDRATVAFFNAAYEWYDSYYGGIDNALSEDAGYAEPAPGGADHYMDEYLFNPMGVVRYGFRVLLVIVVLIAVLALTRVRRYHSYGYRPPSGYSSSSYHHRSSGSRRSSSAGRSVSSRRSSSSSRRSSGFGGGRTRGGGAGR